MVSRRRQAQPLQAEVAEFNARLGLHVDVRDFERARKLTECDVEEYFGFEFYKKNDTERDAYLTACGAA